jgi:phosphorylase kinase alpha/beta subunit
MSTPEEILESYYEEISHTILAYQSPTLGLFPRGTSGHARVKDNVYCAMSIWSLSLAYRHVGNDSGRVYELEQTAVKCMRGLLFCYMKQADKLEKFKQNQSWYNALHVRFECETGEPATQDADWGHLQIDAPSIFLLALAQLTVSGLKVILTMDEVSFIQNLVFYIERAYRIPDHGMWERGTKENINKRELHASSLAMAKAAMEAINGLNMLGYEGSSLSVIHVDPDAHFRNLSTLNTLLPKESSSKDTDAALLCVVGFPAFAIDDKGLARETYQRIMKKLQGSHGLMRFTRDIHHTVKEDKSKVEYGRQELDEFAGIECQWPMFFLYIYLSAMFEGKKELADEYWEKTVSLLVDWTSEEDDFKAKIVPKFYYVPESVIETDSMQTESIPDAQQHSLHRVPSQEKMPFLWAQALYLLARLIRNKFLNLSAIDPIGRYAPLATVNAVRLKRSIFKISPYRDVIIQVALIAETKRLQTILSTHGIPTQTPQQVEPIEILPPSDLVKMLEKLGANEKLKLTGRPLRPVGGLGTSRVYHVGNTKMMFYPNEVDLWDFYMSLDILLLIDHLKTLLHFIQLHWNMDGRPTVCLYLRESIFMGSHFSNMISFLADLKNGQCGGVKIRVDRLQALISTSCVEHLESITDITSLLSRSSSKWSLYSVQSTNSPHFLDDFGSLEPSNTSLLDRPSQEAVVPKVTIHDVEQKSSEDLRRLYQNEPSLLGQAYILNELVKRHGEHHSISLDDITEEVLIDKVNELYTEAGGRKDWSAVRFAACILRKQVDSLSPSVTSIVVREKELTIGVFNCEESVIVEPLPPAELKELIYRTCFKHDIVECVIQQELIIYLGSMLRLNPHIFDGMLRIRIGWIIQAMKNELDRRKPSEGKPLHSLAPNEVKQLLMKVLKPIANDSTEDYLYVRQLNGALGRVPIGFYSKGEYIYSSFVCICIQFACAYGLHVHTVDLSNLPPANLLFSRGFGEVNAARFQALQSTNLTNLPQTCFSQLWQIIEVLRKPSMQLSHAYYY